MVVPPVFLSVDVVVDAGLGGESMVVGCDRIRSVEVGLFLVASPMIPAVPSVRLFPVVIGPKANESDPVVVVVVEPAGDLG